ncbi:Uncharacterised protein [Mycobacteroides abscessus subsp. abscessus]|nr:Uncharacterised protein [Mycobacteroides abscessus subsp. abscessus]
MPILVSNCACETPMARNPAIMSSMRLGKGTPSPFSSVALQMSCAASVNHLGKMALMHSRTARAPALLLLFVMSPRSVSSWRRPFDMRA